MNYHDDFKSQIPGTFILIGINIIFYILTTFFKLTQLYIYFGLIPELFIKRLFIWQPLTHFFLHSNRTFAHIFFNMFMLFMIGIPLESLWGKKKFLQFYILSGFFTGVFAGIIYYLIGYKTVIMIGASGAIYALLMGFALSFPNSVVYIFFILPVKAKYTPFVFGAIDLLLALSNPSSTVAHWAHLMGIFVGFFVYLILIKRTKLSSIIKKNPEKSSKIDSDELFFINQVIYKIKNNIHFSEMEMERLEKLGYKHSRNNVIELCNINDFKIDSINCLKCNKFPFCLIREIKRKGLY